MSVEFLWRLPADGDGRGSGQAQRHRGDYAGVATLQYAFARTGLKRDGFTYYDHLSQIARAAELTGFDGLLIPQTAAGEEPLIVAAALAREIRRLKFVPALPAPLLSAVYTAKIATSFQRLTGGRLAIRLVTEEPGASPWHGQLWSVAEQVARTDEFLDVVKGFWTEKGFTYAGRYYQVENGGFGDALAGQPLPAFYLSGESEEELALGAKHGDVHVLALASVETIQTRIAELDAKAAALGRTIRYALDIDLFARHSDDAARDEARRSEANAGLVGSYATIAERIAAYANAGVSSFVLSANPYLEEAYRIGEQLLPQIRKHLAGVSRQVA